MKRAGLLAVVLMMVMTLQAQTFSEWFRQRRTQIKYLYSQIAALKVYNDYLQKGYSITKDGLALIYDINKGDFDQHDDYFTSLKNVNPSLKNYWKTTAIISLQEKILNVYNHQDKWKSEPLLSEVEKAYCEQVFSKLLRGCSDILSQLLLITTDGSLQMKDDERISRIDSLYADMENRFSFIKSFESEVKLLVIQRKRDERDITVSKSLHSVK